MWAFKLGGTIAVRPALPIAAQEDFAGAIMDTANIETAAPARATGLTGAHFTTHEYEFNPYRARVKPGTKVSWRNNDRMTHTIVAENGSWTTGPLNPLGIGTVTIDKPGTYVYICKEHRWGYTQIVVEPATEKSGEGQPTGK